MATKKITELANITSAQDTDLLIVETANGTRAIKKSDLFSVKVASITLSASGWTGEGTYTQNVVISGATAKSKIDLQPDNLVFNQIINDGVSAMYVVNNNGVFTAYAIGAKPTVNLTIQVTIMEVA